MCVLSYPLTLRIPYEVLHGLWVGKYDSEKLKGFTLKPNINL